jgi:tetratricopeptide (TPR) repeat protein
MPAAYSQEDGEQMDEKVTYRQQVSFCGKPRCRKCRDGTGHGPYWFAYHLTPEGRTVRTYIGKHLPPGIAPPDSSTAAGTTAQPTGSPARDGHKEQQGEIEMLDRQLAHDPTDEAKVQRLMIALARSKRRGEALRAYQRFAALLQSQPGRAPSTATRELFEAVQRGDDISPPASQGEVGRSNQSPLVGRGAEREKLRRFMLAAERGAAVATKATPAATATLALQKPQPQCMVLMGESGIGKTRLVEETAREALQGGWAVAWSHAYTQESGIPYRLWSELLRSLLAQGLWNVLEAGTGGQRYAPLVALLPELREVWEEVVEPDQEQARLREAVYELLETISARAPLLLVLDDVQWADGSSCEMLGYIARRLSNRRIALLNTCRETELASNPTLHSLLGHMQREHVVEYLHVQPLADPEIAALVAHLPDPVVRHIQAQAAGNPFFAEELALSLQDREYKQAVIGAASMIHREATSERVAGSNEETPTLPKTITAALNVRMQRLSAPCQQLLERAAVLGGSFGLPLIYAMEATQDDEDAVLDLLDEAIGSGILTEEGTGARIAYRFWHPLLATHLYTTLSATRRARIHRRAAEALQSVHAAREHGLNEQAAAITDHLLKGGADITQIALFSELAANHAYTLSAYPEAERHYRLAAQYSPSNLAFLLERLAECILIQGRFKEARVLFEQVLELRASQQPAPLGAQEAQVEALLWSEIGWTWRYTGDKERAWQCCKRGEQVLEEASIPSGPARARLYYQQSSLHWQDGHYEEARQAAMQALAVFEAAQAPKPSSPAQQPGEDAAHLTRIRRTILGDPVDLGRTHALLGGIANSTGQRAEAMDHMNEALSIYERYDRQREIAHVCNNIGYVYMKQARYQQARHYFQRAYTLAERIGDTPLLGVTLHNLGELASSPDKRDLAEAELYFRRSLLMAEQIDDREYLSRWNADLALVLIDRHDLTGATQHAARALSVARAMHNTPCVGFALVTLGNLRIALARAAGDGDRHTALACLRRARRTLEHALILRGLEVETSTQGHIALAEACTLLGEHEHARVQASLAMEEAKRYELWELAKRCEQILASF